MMACFYCVLTGSVSTLTPVQYRATTNSSEQNSKIRELNPLNPLFELCTQAFLKLPYVKRAGSSLNRRNKTESQNRKVLYTASNKLHIITYFGELGKTKREERMSLENHIVLWELENEGGRKQLYTVDQPNLTADFPNGARSIRVGKTAGNWRVSPSVEYGGDIHGDLIQGGYYPDPNSMGLTSPVKSIEKQP